MVSETVAPDVLLLVSILIVILVGLGVMRDIALAGSGTMLSAACYLYRLRSSVSTPLVEGSADVQPAVNETGPLAATASRATNAS